MNIPSIGQCLEILKNNNTPSNVIEHCKAVAKVAEEIADNLIKKGIKLDKKLVVASALLHDIERHKEDHVVAGAKLLKKLGFPEIAKVMKYHAYHEMQKDNKFSLSIEQKIVFYADKRVRNDKKVSIDERYDDLGKRYKADLSAERKFVKKMEEELLG